LQMSPNLPTGNGEREERIEASPKKKLGGGLRGSGRKSKGVSRSLRTQYGTKGKKGRPLEDMGEV